MKKPKIEIIDKPCDHFILDPYVCHDFGEPKGQCANCGYYDHEHERKAFDTPAFVTVSMEISECSKCPHWRFKSGAVVGWLCSHPSFKGCKPGENSIAVADDARFPENCPLMPWNRIKS